MTKLKDREQKMKEALLKMFKENDFDNRTVATRVLIETALERASIYQYQKVLMVVEILSKLNDGEYK